MNIEELCFTVDILLAEKEAKHIAPLQVDMHELIKEGVSSNGLLDAMRQLVKMGRYKGSLTINKIPILRRKEAK